MFKDFPKSVAPGGHHGGSYLTEPDAVSPAFSLQHKACPGVGPLRKACPGGGPLRIVSSAARNATPGCLPDQFPVRIPVEHLKGRALQMTFRKDSPDFQLFAHYERILCSNHFKQVYPS